ncbi:hypothetical protein RCG23_25415 [Neobacillus sp. PS3-34]|uniref:hypothetical protein n=1 Tax=Neobacillus sp. PS3-34 TaxID=3070678 RepID=UPI0027E0FE59|nr:hypothetical protein [Neobacillus sp. PS3-34]WML48519.1 hypothetical protein RCG23_25415 [Neobacillus sp. PS3-34]
MAIVQKDGFNSLDGLNSEYIVFDSNRLKEYVDYINAQGISAIAINDSYYLDDNIDFLRNCPNVKKVNINGTFIENYEGLNYLNHLHVLFFGDPKTKVDVSKFHELQELYVDMNKNVVGIKKCINLRVLKMWKYKPKTNDLTELSDLSKIEQLAMTQSTIISLTGISAFPKLLKLDLNFCSKLESIKQISEGSQKIKELAIESCKNIKDFSEINTLKELEKLLFTDSGEIPSIRFIEELPQLKSFVFMGTTVEDGNLNPCIGLEYVAFTQKKHYTHKMKDFNL